MSDSQPAKTMAQRMELKPATRMLVLNMPDDYPAMIGPLPEGIVLDGSPSSSLQPYDVVHLFATLRHELEALLPTVRHIIAQNGSIWVSWPNKSSDVASDLDEDQIREVALARRLEVVTVAAVDDVWFGLKLMIRPDDRTG